MAKVRRRKPPARKPSRKPSKKRAGRAKLKTRVTKAKKRAPAKAKKRAPAKAKKRAPAKAKKRVAKTKKRVAKTKKRVARVTKRKPTKAKTSTPAKAAKPKAASIFTHLEKIPDPAELHRIAVALHVLETIAGARFPSFEFEVMPDHRRFYYDHGNGDGLFLFFSADGHLARGIDHESPVTPHRAGRILPGLYAGLPNTDLMRSFVRAIPDLDEETFAHDDGDDAGPATFAAWWDGNSWRAGNQKLPEFDAYQSDGARYLFNCLSPDVRFCEQKNFPRDTVAKVMAHEPISDDEIRALSPNVDVARVREAMKNAGYAEPFPYE